jgi:glucose-1-phosphate adenylyltransferase
MAETIAMILAGGQGSRLSILSEHRAKPAVPFGSNYRIIDFVLSNVMQSGIRYLGVMTQYKPYSLMAHVCSGEAWGFTGRQSVAKILPPYVGSEAWDWYGGTADAVYQNLSFINRFNVDTVLILSGDHIYNMPYGDLLEAHAHNKADVTIATQPVPWEDTPRFGLVQTDRKGRVEAFHEKPKSNPVSNLANLGIYIFNRPVLEQALREDAEMKDSTHDFGADVLPRLVQTHRCFSWEFNQYWRDVGTLQSYWDANMDCLSPRTGIDLATWRVQTNWVEVPNDFHMPTHVYGKGTIINSIVGKGSTVRGKVVNSILFRGVEVGEDAEIRDSVIMDAVTVAPGAKLRHVIADKCGAIGAGAQIGLDDADTAPPNREHPTYLNTSLTLLGMYTRIPDNFRIGRNCLIYPDLDPESFPGSAMASGETLHNPHAGEKRRQ